jgi:hypothetical protein
MAVTDDIDHIDSMIKQTVKTFKSASAMQVWTWTMNREGNLLAIEARLDALAHAGFLKPVTNSFPPAFTMGRWK